jgi:hypothetical protein
MVQRDQLDQLDHCGVKLVADELGRDAAFEVRHRGASASVNQWRNAFRRNSSSLSG